MVASDEDRLIFMHIPKTAGIFIRRSLADDRRFAGIRLIDGLGERDTAHLPLRLVAEHFPADFAKFPRYRSFASIRDPGARFVSSVAEHIKQFRKIPKEQVSDAMIIEVAREIVGHLPSDDPEYAHFLPQVEFVELDGRRVVTDLFAFSNLEAMVAAMEAYTGKPMDRQPKNVADKALHPALHRGWRKVRSVAPWAAPLGRSRLARKLFVRRNGVELPKDLKDFIDDFYAADIALHREVLNAADRAGDKVAC